ncbi:hypothetical protein CMK21_07085 [Candidatus Poribacteria bacterium]|nr:hypothetical protein [Candidatus Poribacteria bacterium]
MKVSVVGQKNAVLLIAQHICRLKEVTELALVDEVHSIPDFILAELKMVASILRSDVRLIASRNPSVLAGSEVVVYCPFDFNQPKKPSPAGYFRSFESTNKDRIGGVYQHAPEAKIVVATHPSTEIVQSIHQNSNANLGQVIGISGYLINTDLKVEISEAVGVSVEDVVSLIIGNDDEYHMLPQYCCAGGIPIDQLLSQNQIAKLGSNVRSQPKKLVYTDFVHTISVLTAQVVKTILLNKKRIMAVATMIEANGIEVCLNLPAKIGRNGAEKLTSLHLTNKQLEQFMALVKKAATQPS